MKARNIVKINSKNSAILTAPTEYIEENEHEELVREMQKRTFPWRFKLAVGVAGNQVGLAKQIFIAKIGQIWEYFINPIIIWEDDGMYLEKEECLSIPRKQADLYRSNCVTVSWRDSSYYEFTRKFVGHEARIVQHEIDHLKGILISDRLQMQNTEHFKTKLKNHVGDLTFVGYEQRMKRHEEEG